MKILLPRMMQVAFCILGAVALLPSSAQAIRIHNYDLPFPIVSREQAEGLKPGAKIAMSCMKCRTVQVREVDKNRTFLEWFNPKVKHVCPACGGHWGTSFTAKGAAMVTGSTPAQNAEINRGIAVLRSRAKRPKACDGL